MKRLCPYRAVLAATALVALLSSAKADDGILTGTLKAIKDRGTIVVGYRENVPPFSFKNRAGQPVGFSLDICHAIAEEAAKQLGSDLLEPEDAPGQPGLRLTYVPVSADTRLDMVANGVVDLECGSTTATDARAKTVAFSPVMFLAGTKLLAPISGKDGMKVQSYRDLAGRKLAVATGTTTDAVVKGLAGKTSPPITIVEQPSVDAAYAQVAAGAADAMASDDVLLAGLVATRPDGRKFTVVGDFLSYEPYAIMYHKDDPDFAAVVRTAFETMATSDKLMSNYRRWFEDNLPNGENLRLPISAQLTEFYRILGQTD